MKANSCGMRPLALHTRPGREQAIGMWLGMDDLQHCLVIGSYFHYAGGFSPARAFDCSPTGPGTNDPLFVVEATKL